MFKVAKIASIGKNTLSKIASPLKTTGSVLAKTTLGAIKLPFGSLMKMTSSMIPMMGSALLGGIYLLIKLLK